MRETDHALPLPGGRGLGWAAWGRPDGSPVLLLHCTPGSRLLDPDPEATRAAGVRLLTLDRPGYGRTDPVADPRRAVVAADVEALIDSLGLGEVALTGWSGGGYFAVEAAARMGGRVRSLSLLATPAPDEEIPWVADQFRPLAGLARGDAVQAARSIAEQSGWYAQQPESALAAWATASDLEVRSRPGASEALTAMMREGARQGGAGVAFDVVAGSRGDPLPLRGVRAPVHLWYGDADAIGPEHGRWYRDRLPGATLTVLPGAGHLLPLASWGPILRSAQG
jgi:pimeloyl-ACP methyl ester carboxylesterase